MSVVMSEVEARYLSLQDAERYSGLSVSSLRRLIARKELKAIRPMSNKILLDRREIDAFLQRAAAT